ncbi:hypothetical protein ABIE89_007530 [Bradyrhizobium niftali]
MNIGQFDPAMRSRLLITGVEQNATTIAMF